MCDNSFIIHVLLFGDDWPCSSYMTIAALSMHFHGVVVVERIAAHSVCNSGPQEATIDFSSPLPRLSGDKVRFLFLQDDS